MRDLDALNISIREDDDLIMTALLRLGGFHQSHMKASSYSHQGISVNRRPSYDGVDEPTIGVVVYRRLQDRLSLSTKSFDILGLVDIGL